MWDYPDYIKILHKLKRNDLKIFVLLYDCIPFKLPHSFGPNFALKFNEWLKEVVEIGANFITISESSKSDILEFCSSQEISFTGDIFVIKLGDCILSNKVSRYNININEPFILCVGTIEYRKNHQLILDAYRVLLRKGVSNLPKVVVVGKQGWMDNHIIHQIQHDTLIKDYFLVLTDVTDDELRYLYKNCLFTLYPSFYEGWGLPVAESFAYGKMCLHSNVTSMPEICSKVSVMLDPSDPFELANQLNDFIHNNNQVKYYEELIQKYYKRQNWSSCAISIVNTFLAS
jgi:glycosyltransferase involved in cell wall biosynthesis